MAILNRSVNASRGPVKTSFPFVRSCRYGRAGSQEELHDAVEDEPPGDRGDATEPKTQNSRPRSSSRCSSSVMLLRSSGVRGRSRRIRLEVAARGVAGGSASQSLALPDSSGRRSHHVVGREVVVERVCLPRLALEFPRFALERLGGLAKLAFERFRDSRTSRSNGSVTSRTSRSNSRDTVGSRRARGPPVDRPRAGASARTTGARGARAARSRRRRGSRLPKPILGRRSSG